MLLAIVEAKVLFAVKSGGHATITGASNINGIGVTIDLARLVDVELSEDKQTVRIGTGAKWSDVYVSLEQDGLSIPGGRAGVVGVGGFLLGGGVSWFSNTHGWSCDSVEAYEVVLANGEIIEASIHHHADLFWALKGGGGIFGLVTGFRMRTIASTGLRAGSISYVAGQQGALFATLVRMVQTMTPREQSSTFVSCGYMPTWSSIRCSSYLVDIPAQSHSPILEPFFQLPHTGGNLRIMNFSQSAEEMAEYTAEKFRQAKFTLTLHAEDRILDLFYSRFTAVSKLWSFKSQESLIAITFQPLSASHLSGRDNPLGFPAAADPLILFSFEVRWPDAANDGYYEKRMRQLHDNLRTVASDMGLLHRWVYANYAAKWQNVYEGYGEENVDRLKGVREKYDENGVFSILRAGGLDLT